MWGFSVLSMDISTHGNPTEGWRLYSYVTATPVNKRQCADSRYLQQHGYRYSIPVWRHPMAGKTKGHMVSCHQDLAQSNNSRPQMSWSQSRRLLRLRPTCGNGSTDDNNDDESQLLTFHWYKKRDQLTYTTNLAARLYIDQFFPIISTFTSPNLRAWSVKQGLGHLWETLPLIPFIPLFFK